jgi:hypothetical protein
MKKIIGIVSAMLALASVAITTATASSASTSSAGSTTGAACVFNAPALFYGMAGHVGWGFELANGNWEYGANKGPINVPRNMFSNTVWHPGSKTKMLGWFKAEGGYTYYRCATVRNSNASAAEREVRIDQHLLYTILPPFEDCETQVYNVLNAYGVKFLPTYLLVPEPNSWFNLLYLAGFGSYTPLSAS